ncbi:MAG: hypothetical protein ACKO9T_10165, partial [Nitrospira sp.]
HSMRTFVPQCVVYALLAAGILLATVPLPPASAAPYFQDGFLGLTQTEVRAKLGPPQAVRDKKSALRFYRYYAFADWENSYKKQVGPQNGEDVYTYKRDGTDVRYSFAYVTDPDDLAETPTMTVNLVDVEFSPPVPLSKIALLVPEFKPPVEPTAPTFRSNVMVLLFAGTPSAQARAIVREPGREKQDWSLAFQMYALQGLPEYLTPQAPVDRMEISVQSVQLVRDRQRHTHQPIMNPFSKEFARLPPPAKPAKKIPVPRYAD